MRGGALRAGTEHAKKTCPVLLLLIVCALLPTQTAPPVADAAAVPHHWNQQAGVFTALPGALGCPSSRGWAPINNGISSTTRADLQSHFYVVGGNCSQSVVCVEQSSSQVKTNVRRAEQLTIKTRRSEISMMGSQAPPGQSSSHVKTSQSKNNKSSQSKSL